MLRIYSSFLTENLERDRWLPQDADVDELRAMLAAFVAVASNGAKSGFVQARVHAGLAHRDQIGFFWHPKRFAKLSHFSREIVHKLDTRLAALNAQIVAPTLH